MSAPCGIVTLTTDFGLSDSYVAQMHAVILAGCPEARIVDVSHEVPPGQLESALFLTESAWPHFPGGTVHVVVVDPGVGTDRGLIAIEGPEAFFVGPDTGALSSAIAESERPAVVSRQALSAGQRAVEISGSGAKASVVSTTFHGRDIMAPVAARLACGTPLESLGRAVASVMVAPSLATSGEAGRVIHIDRFGNAVTSFRSADAAGELRLIVTTGWRDEVSVGGVETTYEGTDPPIAIVVAGSSGYLEIAWPRGDAAERLGLRIGDSVRLAPS